MEEVLEQPKSSARYKQVTYFLMVCCISSIFVSNSIFSAFYLLLGLVGLFELHRFEKRHLNTPIIMMACFIVSALTSNIVNYEILDAPWRSFRGLRVFILSLPIMLVFLRLFNCSELEKSEKTSKIVKFFLIFTSIATLSGLIALATGFNPLRMKPVNDSLRNSGMYGMYMTYAYGISLFLTLNIAFALFFDRLKLQVSKKLIWGAMVLNLVGLYFSYTRGALIGLFVSVPFLFLVKSKKLFFSVFIILSVLFSSYVFLSPSGRNLFFSKTRITSNNQRLAFYEAAYLSFKERPVFGIGYKNFEAYSAKIKKKFQLSDHRKGHAHNIYLEVMANQGTFGIITLMLFLFSWLWIGMKLGGAVGISVIAFIINFMVSGLFQNTFGDSENLQFVILFWALTMAGYFSRRSYSQSL